ncbi:hypothetical protein KNT87_gp060 [Erwinia phage Cronus]|uniref:Uncharacterized protein n=1 Tax=Erwinia phage Cronus TaxID=2163633 RepID=A0A2S1GM94_9CAUD|nr:hypothetical protein KNT87_gp060 [Erwinia phage Cronus]AWD90499.1 hypothetical protein [Erwinia phage Cronus]
MYKYMSWPGYRGAEVQIRMSSQSISVRFRVKDSGAPIQGPSWSKQGRKPFNDESLEAACQKFVEWGVQDKTHCYMPDEIVTEVYNWIKVNKF